MVFPVLRLESSVASLIRWASPPESSVDGCLKRIELTSKAEEIRHLITSEIAESENLLLKGITEEERRIFIEIGKKMLKNLDEAE
jgi:DNA-binding MarR family transcriptional regulator